MSLVLYQSGSEHQVSVAMDKFRAASELPGGMAAIAEAVNGPVGDPVCRSVTIYILSNPELNLWNGHPARTGRLPFQVQYLQVILKHHQTMQSLLKLNLRNTVLLYLAVKDGFFTDMIKVSVVIATWL